jgi:hypothetical protein
MDWLKDRADVAREEDEMTNGASDWEMGFPHRMAEAEHEAALREQPDDFAEPLKGPLTIEAIACDGRLFVPQATLDPDYHKQRKGRPLTTGVLDYFPDALLAVSELSRIGNDQHNPGQPLHWAKEKSTDHADCIARHLLERGKIDPASGLSHSVGVAWRALAMLQIEIENARKESQ